MKIQELRFVSLLVFFVSFFVFFLLFPTPILAHPGNTAADGCHYCWTNCAKWGYTYNTRHGHHGEICNPSKGPIDPLYFSEKTSSNSGGLNLLNLGVWALVLGVPTWIIYKIIKRNKDKDNLT